MRADGELAISSAGADAQLGEGQGDTGIQSRREGGNERSDYWSVNVVSESGRTPEELSRTICKKSV